MKQKPYKIITLSTLIAAITSGSIMPVYTVAAEIVARPIPSSTQIDSSNKYSEYSLGPAGLKDAMVRTGSNSLVMDLYALTIIKQANVNFNKVTVVDDSLKTKINYHQDIARRNANQWLDTIKPLLISTNQNIINYNTKFQNYYDTLVAAIDNKDKATLIKGIERLSTSISENKEKVDKLVDNLKKFRDKMTADTQNFKGDASQLTSILSSRDAGIPLLERQMTTYNEAASKLNTILIGSTVTVALGPIVIVGGAVIIATGGGIPLGVALIIGGLGFTGGGTAGVVLARKELDNARLEIQKVEGQLSEAKIQVAGLTNIKNQTEYLTNTIDMAITALQNISNQWHTMGAKYNSLCQNVESISSEDFAFIKEDLNTAQKSWDHIKEYAEKLYVEDIKVVDTESIDY
ncbi:alpha-helical pore-forming toxin family protein (plasmid) [Bacillus mycoides]|nr:alpha-helical pore-forming toxin family protein [Bacillus mycoides]